MIGAWRDHYRDPIHPGPVLEDLLERRSLEAPAPDKGLAPYKRGLSYVRASHYPSGHQELMRRTRPLDQAGQGRRHEDRLGPFQ